MADCGNYEDLISALIDGELTDDEIRKLKQHSRNCRSCAEFIKLYSAMSSAMNELTETPPNDLSLDIMSQIRYDSKRSRRGHGLRRLTAIAAVLFVIITGFFLMKQALPFNGSSDYTSKDESAVMESASDVSPEVFSAGSEESQVTDSADMSTDNSILPTTEPAEPEQEQSSPEDTDQSFEALGEGNSIIEVSITDESGKETEIPADADLLDKLFTYSGVYGETVTEEPLCKIKISLDGEEQTYSVWVSNESVLIQGVDGILYISAVDLESFKNLLP